MTVKTDLATARRGRGISQRKLAEIAGVSRTTIATTELGMIPGAGSRKALARALDLSPEQIWPDAEAGR